MRLVPAGTSTSLPLMVSLGMRPAPDQRLELLAELLDVADVRPHGPIVEGADRGARPPLGHIEDGVEVFLAALALDDPVDHLVDPARGFPAGRALAARLMRVEARHDHEGMRDGHGLVHD